MCVYNFFVINLNVNIYLCMVCFFMRTEGLYIKQVTLPSAQPTINEPKNRPRLLFFTSRHSPPPPWPPPQLPRYMYPPNLKCPS